MDFDKFDLSFNRDFRESKKMISVDIRTKNIDYAAPGDHLWKAVTRLTIIAVKYKSFDTEDRGIFQPAPSDPLINGWHVCQRISQIHRDSYDRVAYGSSPALDVPSTLLMIESQRCAAEIGQLVEDMCLEIGNYNHGFSNIYKRLGGYDFEHQKTLAKNYDNQTLTAKDLGNGFHLVLGEIWASLDDAMAYYKKHFPLTQFAVRKDPADTFLNTLGKACVIQKGERG
jgi:hypothetical protein